MILIAALGLLACDKKQGASKGAGIPLDAEMQLPKVEGAEPIERQDRVIVDLTEHGEIRFEGKPLSLDGLGTKLAEHKRMLHLNRKREGRSGYVKGEGGVEASALYVLLRADRRAVWEHACLIFMVCAEERIFRLQLAVEGGKIDAFLPIDKSAGTLPLEPVNEIVVQVDLLGRNERAVGWGPTGKRETVRRPTKVVYRYGGREGSDPRRVTRFAKDAMKVAQDTERARVIGSVRAQAKMEFGLVVDILARVRASGIKDVGFMGIRIPSRQLRKSPTLPYPKENRLIPGFGFELEEPEEPLEEEDD